MLCMEVKYVKKWANRKQKIITNWNTFLCQIDARLRAKDSARSGIWSRDFGLLKVVENVLGFYFKIKISGFLRQRCPEVKSQYFPTLINKQLYENFIWRFFPLAHKLFSATILNFMSNFASTRWNKCLQIMPENRLVLSKRTGKY